MADQLPISERQETVPQGDSSHNSNTEKDITYPPTPSRFSWKSLQQDVDLRHVDIPVVASCFTTGLTDSVTFNAWGAFVSMQTGNTIILALGASALPPTHPYLWLKALLAILAFLAGCLFFASTRHLGGSRRIVLAASFLIQSALIFISAALVQAGVVAQPEGLSELDPGTPDFWQLLPIALLAFQSGGQIVTSRIVKVSEVSTNVLTSLYCDLMSDPDILRKENVKRNRRIAGATVLLIGGIVGGWLSRTSGMSAALFLAGSVKFAIAVGWVLWKPREE